MSDLRFRLYCLKKFFMLGFCGFFWVFFFNLFVGACFLHLEWLSNLSFLGGLFDDPMRPMVLLVFAVFFSVAQYGASKVITLLTPNMLISIRVMDMRHFIAVMIGAALAFLIHWRIIFPLWATISGLVLFFLMYIGMERTEFRFKIDEDFEALEQKK